MSRNILKTFGKIFLILVVLILMSAFKINQVQPQQTSPTATPTLTTTLQSGEEQKVSDTQDQENEFSFEAYAGYTPTPLPEIKNYQNTASFTFSNLGVDPIVLRFPYVYEMGFSLPNQWNIFYPRSFLELHYDLIEDPDWEGERPLVEIFINGYLAGILAPEKGKGKIARIELPHLLVQDRPYNFLNTYFVSFRYHIGEGDVFNDDWCDYGGVLTINDDSTIDLVFDEVSVKRDLSDFPRPLVQDSFIPETLHFILPDDFNENDIATLATVASAFGRGTNGNVKFNVITASEVSQDMLLDSNAVIIGKPSSNAFLEDLYNRDLMHTELSFDGSLILGLSDQDDGLLQLIASSQNSKYSYLIVSGNNDRGVLRAAQALSDPPQGMSGFSFFVESDIDSSPIENEEKAFTKSFSELGFEDIVVYGVGRNQHYFPFFVPRNWEIQDGAKLFLNYAHSTGISYSHSTVNVYLNEVPIANASINEQIGEKQIEIPLRNDHILVGTQNMIRIETVIEQRLDCAAYDIRSSWMTIRDSSILHIPYEEIENAKDLPSIAHPFYYLGRSSELLISLPPVPNKEELDGLAHLSFVLGNELVDDQTGFNFSVNLDPDFDPNTKSEANMILIGKPSTNDMIADINEDLPQPFIFGEDSLVSNQFANQYRIQEDISIGLIQALPAPWNPFRGLTVITGTSDEGLKWALDASKNDNVSWFAMAGDIIFVRESLIEAFQSSSPVRVSLDVVLSEMTEKDVNFEDAQPTEPAPLETTPDKYVQITSQQNTSIGLYAVYGLVFVGAIVAIIGLARTTRGGRKR